MRTAGTNSQLSNFSNSTTSSLRATATQHILQGCCVWLNTRFIVQAKNDRRITDSAFRQQVIYTITQVEDIYWALVSAYEDEQAKERALQQSTQLDGGQPQAAGDWDAGAAGRGELRLGCLDRQAGADFFEVEPGISAAADEAGDCAEPERPAAGECAGCADGPRRARPAAGRRYAGGRPGAPGVHATTRRSSRPCSAMENNKITIRAEKNGLLPVLDAFGVLWIECAGRY